MLVGGRVMYRIDGVGIDQLGAVLASEIRIFKKDILAREVVDC